MKPLGNEIADFAARRRTEHRSAAQMAAFYILSGIDLAEALQTTGDKRSRILMRIRRLLERERLKGVNRHWSYDLNRHIALKQAFDRLRGPEGTEMP